MTSPMMNKVLWVLDNEMNGRDFERLCVALLQRSGYQGILPVGGTGDNGRDAELVDEDGNVTFFQFSLEQKWRKKLESEQEKVRDRGHCVHRYVFVTSRTVTGRARDELKARARERFGWHLEIFEREWLRHQLEEVHNDLAERYLNVSVGSKRPKSDWDLSQPATPAQVRELLEAGRAEEAIVLLRRLIADSPTAGAWAALAWAQYKLYHYNDALWAINQALVSAPSAPEYLNIKACVLAEDGIASSSRLKLLAARDILETLVARAENPTPHYNLANVLSALGDYVSAKDHYVIALGLNDSLPDVWKNLGSTHVNLGAHEEALRCFERALGIDPRLDEARVSKGILLGTAFDRHEEALALLDAALTHRETAHRWPQAFWWKAVFLKKLERYAAALEAVNEGIEHAPDHRGLGELKARLLARLWRQDRTYVAPAEAFFARRVEVDATEIASMRELAEISATLNNEQALLRWLTMSVEAASGFHYSTEEVHAAGGAEALEVLSRRLALYTAYRKSAPLERCEELDSFELRDEIHRLAWLALGIEFCRFADAVLLPTAKQLGVREVASLFDSSRSAVLSASSQAAGLLALRAAEASQEEKVLIFSQIATAMPWLAVYEAGAQVGYLAGRVEVEPHVVRRVQCVDAKRTRVTDWMGSVLEAVLKQANEHLGLLAP